MTDRAQYIENLKNLKKSISELSVYGLDVYTAIELYYILAQKQNEVINELNRFENVTDSSFDYLFNEGVITEVRAKLDELNSSGELTQIIEQQCVPDLYNKLDNLRRKVNVRDFGAVGDGVTDDTQAIKDALATCGSVWSNKPSVLYFPRGNYIIKECITLDEKYLSIEGEGLSNTNIISQGTHNGIDLIGSSNKNQLWGNTLRNFTLDCSNLNGTGILGKHLGLEFMMENVYIINTNGKGLHLKSPYDCILNNVTARGCQDVGIHLEEITTDEDGWHEMSYISLNRCTVVECGKNSNNKIQWLITGGNNLYFNDCKGNEGYVGILFNGNTWSSRINNFYMDGLSGTDGDGNYARAFVLDGSGINDMTIGNVYTWNCGHVLHIKQATSVDVNNLSRNKWDTYGTGKEMIKIADTFDGRLTLDGKYYAINCSDTKKYNLASSVLYEGNTGVEIIKRTVRTNFYSGANRVASEVNGFKNTIFATASINSDNEVRCKSGNTERITPHVQWNGGYTVCYLELPSGEVADESKEMLVEFLIVVETPRKGDY